MFVFAVRYSPLSNHYPINIEIDGETYPSAEHFYQYQKCLASGNAEAAATVLMSKQPEDAMAAGSKVKQPTEWTKTEGKKLMKKAANAKFSSANMQLKLKATGKRKIAEATRNTLWGSGHSFTGDCLTLASIKGDNLMGEILMELRDDMMRNQPLPAEGEMVTTTF